MADSTVETREVDKSVQGQGEKVRVREFHVATDKVILDPDSPEAVQIPDGAGGSTVDAPLEIVAAVKRGTAEEQLSGASPEEVDNTRPAKASEKSSK